MEARTDISRVSSSDAEFVFGQPVGELYRDPAGYDPGPDLEAAIRVAMLLGLPLLLTGEPGCGKTSVAYWLAWKLKTTPLVFNVKSSNVGRDLLYEFDELARFRDGQAGRVRPALEYLRLNALGLAILCSLSGDTPLDNGMKAADLAPKADSKAFGLRHVVLIDELDKAPRDTPNDLLAEIDQMNFRIRELDTTVVGAVELRPVVIITSNSEKSLPEPFLRRCVFHHIAGPDDTRRREIVLRRRHPFAQRAQLFDQAMRYFDRLSVLSRAPGTAELLAWLTALESRVKSVEARDMKPVTALKGVVKPSLGTLAKTKEDLELAQHQLESAGLS